MTTVASISFRNDKSLSMDVEGVNAIAMAAPVQLEDGSWACELIIRTSNGTVALQLQASSPDKFTVRGP
jgi:hypothetical protein